jgi:hypothetical protein
MTHCRAALVGGLFWALALPAEICGADAIPPPPENCPGDTVPTSDHGGQRCEPPPPKNCPPGYVGRVGGACALHRCFTDQDCGRGKQCLDAQICFEPHEVWVEYGRAPVSRDNLLAGPPIRLDEPKTVFDPVGVCQQAGHRAIRQAPPRTDLVVAVRGAPRGRPVERWEGRCSSWV